MFFLMILTYNEFVFLFLQQWRILYLSNQLHFEFFPEEDNRLGIWALEVASPFQLHHSNNIPITTTLRTGVTIFIRACKVPLARWLTEPIAWLVGGMVGLCVLSVSIEQLSYWPAWSQGGSVWVQKLDRNTHTETEYILSSDKRR